MKAKPRIPVLRLVILFVVSSSLPERDQYLVQIVDAALAEATRKSGSWLACRPGCTQCCIGVFAINQLDAARLRHGIAELEKLSPERATAVRKRARQSIEKIGADFPGDLRTGVLHQDSRSKARFEGFANDEPCPALDPDTGCCDVYKWRPMTCRVFGPPVRSEGGLGICELCFRGATPEQVADCEMTPDPDDIESILVNEVEKTAGVSGETIVAYCLADDPR